MALSRSPQQWRLDITIQTQHLARPCEQRGVIHGANLLHPNHNRISNNHLLHDPIPDTPNGQT